MLLRDDGLAVPMLKLGLPPLQLLSHPRGEMNLPIPVFYSGKDGLLEMEKRPDVKWSGFDCPTNCIQVTIKLAYLRAVSLCCELSSSVSKRFPNSSMTYCVQTWPPLRGSYSRQPLSSS